MREYLARLLSPKYEVVSAANGLEALSVLRSSPNAADLVLTDVMMPFLDGFGLLKEIRGREETRTMPVIMLSARAGEEVSAEGLAEGADDYLIKPFTARELLSRVASHLKMARMRSEAASTEHNLRMEVHEAKERLERILASIQDAFVSLDSKLRFTFVNQNAGALLGAKKDGNLPTPSRKALSERLTAPNPDGRHDRAQCVEIHGGYRGSCGTTQPGAGCEGAGRFGLRLSLSIPGSMVSWALSLLFPCIAHSPDLLWRRSSPVANVSQVRNQDLPGRRWRCNHVYHRYHDTQKVRAPIIPHWTGA